MVSRRTEKDRKDKEGGSEEGRLLKEKDGY
jgi:hypothetical protein